MSAASAARRQAFAEDLLGGAHARAERHLRTEVRERELERRKADDDVERPDVAQVREADDLALQLVLTARERHLHLVAQILEERAAVDVRREVDRGGGRARRLRREQRQAERLRAGAPRAGAAIVPGVEV